MKQCGTQDLNRYGKYEPHDNIEYVRKHLRETTLSPSEISMLKRTMKEGVTHVKFND